MTDLGPSKGCILFQNEGKDDKHSFTIEIVMNDVSTKLSKIVMNDVSTKLSKLYYVRRSVTFANLGIRELKPEHGTEWSGASWEFFVRFSEVPNSDNDIKTVQFETLLVLEKGGCPLAVNATCTFSMLNINGMELERGVGRNLRSRTRQAWKYSCEGLLENPLFIDDSLRYCANVEFTFVTETEIPMMCAPSELSARSCSAMFNSPRFSDFQLQSSDGKVLQVHKFILGTRSEVFSAMFEHKMKESETGRCVIDDVDGETLEAMIKFVYGRNEWKPHLAEKLIVAANKYKILDLVDGCTTELISQLTAKNAAGLLKLADEISAQKLKDAVLNFVTGNLDGFHEAGGFVELAENVGLLEELKDFSSQVRKNKMQKTTA